jgi:alkylation response protein AidB-like acyl-CoA dehydrogenase
VDFTLNPDVAALAAEVRQFLAEHLSDEVRDRMHRTGTAHDWDLHRAIAARGWLASAVPGSPDARDPFEMAVLFRELELADAPYHGLATTMLVAGVLQQAGSDALKAQVLPEILAGRAIASLGYSEPDHGSDVAAASTRAVPNDDGGETWTINGQKMWTTLAHVAQHVLLLTRTNPDVPKHRGLTMFLVPLDTPGITVQAVHTMASDRTNVTFYDDVVVSDSCRVGDVDGGWAVMAIALGLERGVMGGTAFGEVLWPQVRAWATSAGLIEQPSVRQIFARTRIDNEVSWLLTQRTAWIASSGALPSVEGSITKLFASEAYKRAARAWQDVAGPAGLLDMDATDSIAHGAIERAARHAPVTTIYGGTSEIQRNNIAERHLGLPSTRPRKVSP